MIYDKEDENQNIELLKLEKRINGKTWHGKKEEKWRRIDLFRKFFKMPRNGEHSFGIQCFEPKLFEGGSIEDDSYLTNGAKSSKLALSHSTDPRRTEGMGREIDKILSYLRKTDRCIFILRFFWEFENKEIGYCFGVSASRISQRISRIQKTISEIILQDGNEERLKEIREKQRKQSKTYEGEEEILQVSRQRKGNMGRILSIKREEMESRKNKRMEGVKSFKMESYSVSSF